VNTFSFGPLARKEADESGDDKKAVPQGFWGDVFLGAS